MALRVLLADNSESIRRVIQLSLQDFGVEVKSVHLGVDVLHIARAFQPDIIFVDILLQKRNGYEVAQTIKADPALAPVPVVLMWSGFMDFDEAKAHESGAEGRLEKPFDSETIRGLITQLVPRTKQHPLGSHIVSPTIAKPAAEQKAEKKQTPPPAAPSAPTTAQTLAPSIAPAMAQPQAPPPLKIENPQEHAMPQESGTNWNMDSFEPLDSFIQTHAPEISLQKDASEFGELPELELQTETHFAPAVKAPDKAPQFTSFDFGADDSEDEFSKIGIDEVPTQVKNPAPQPSTEVRGVSHNQQTVENDQEWVKKDLEEFRLDLPENADTGEIDVEIPMEHAPIVGTDFLYTKEHTQTETAVGRPAPRQAPIETALPSLTPDQIEEFLRRQSQEIIREIAMRVVPEVATEIIQREIRRLMEDPTSL